MLRICRFSSSDAIGTGFLYQPEGSLLTLRRRRRKYFVFADRIAPLGAGGTGGHQLWPQVSPRAGVSLAGEHNPDRSPRNSNRQFIPLSSREDSPTANFRNSPLANFPRTVFVKLKHAMNSVVDEIHRFALPKATQTAIETRIGKEVAG